ncbi:MAG: ATP-binding protein [Desulfobacterales bacterium]|nr:MAG: ATP-binding protein [Desulfobacterales bacterium]
MAKKTYSFELKSNLSELDRLCHNLQQFCHSMGLHPKCLFEINLALDELFTNIISYGFQDDKEHQIKFTLTPQKDLLILCIEDDGVPFNPIEADTPDLECSISECKIGGLGIHLIKNLMDEVCYRRCRGKNILTMKKKIDAHEAAG